MTITDLGYGPEEEDDEDELLVAPEPEIEEDEFDLDEEMADFLDQLITRTILFCEELAGFELFPYQRAPASRIVESLILGDAEEITALLARQSGAENIAGTDKDALDMAWEVVRAVLQGLAVWWYDHPHIPRAQIVRTAMNSLWIGLERVAHGDAWRPERNERQRLIKRGRGV